MEIQRIKIKILLASYNGEKYIYQQIKSIIQSCLEAKVDYKILVSDDFSTDSTVEIVNEFGDPNIKLISPYKKTGSAKGNFIFLLNYASLEKDSFEYFMLSDQDDIWTKDKVILSLKKIDKLEGKSKKPALVFTDSLVYHDTDDASNISFWENESFDPNVALNCKKIILHNVVQGATSLFNKNLLLISTPIPYSVTMHDHWLAVVASFIGEIGYLKEQTVLYRQHDFNEIGSKKRTFYSLVANLKHSLNGGRESIKNCLLQADSFILKFQSNDLLSHEDRKYLKDIIEIKNKNFCQRKLFFYRHGLIFDGFYRNIGYFILF